MRRERTCKGCDGTGEPHRRLPIPDISDGRHFWLCGTCGAQNSREDGECQFCECNGLECTRSNCSDPSHFFADCPACLGTGVVEDHITVADALADAETLAWELQNFLHRIESPETSGLGRWREEHSYTLAVRAARAAFRAVPGLRG